MATRADLNALCRRRLADISAPVEWSEIQINQWINDAIADYSRHFAYLEEGATINCVADQREYSLTSLTNPQAIVRVEYPQGEDPPELLTRRDVTDPRGFYGGQLYHVRGHPPARLIIGETPSTGEVIELDYHRDHDYLDDDSDVTTVPDKHFELIVLFVRWAAHQELSAEESKNPDPTTLLASTFALNASRTEREYRAALKRYTEAESSPGTIQWDLNDRWRNDSWA